MKTFYLKTKDGEVISSKKLNSLDEAISFFAAMKQISEWDLLKIYDVD
jgi:hypothetical protein